MSGKRIENKRKDKIKRRREEKAAKSCLLDEDIEDASLETFWHDARKIFAHVDDASKSYLAKMKRENIDLQASFADSYHQFCSPSHRLSKRSDPELYSKGCILSSYAQCPPLLPLKTMMKAASMFPQGFQNPKNKPRSELSNQEGREITQLSSKVSERSFSYALGSDDENVVNQGRHQKRAKIETNSWKCNDYCFVVPTVPVAIHHPACWSLASRIDSIESSREWVHPASWSHFVTQPRCSDVIESTTEDRVDDIKDLLEADLKAFLLQNSLNVVALQRLENAMNVAAGVDRLRARRMKLQKALECVYKANEPRTARRQTYVLRTATAGMSNVSADRHSSFRDSETVVVDDAVDAETTTSTSTVAQIRYATRCSSASLVKEKHESVRHQPLTAEEYGLKRMLGPCLEQHVEHGSFVSKLMTGTAVEVKVHGGWQPGVVKRLRFDGETLLRFVKVSVLNSFVGDALWVTTSDGHLAPPRTNLKQDNLWIQHQETNIIIDRTETQDE